MNQFVRAIYDDELHEGKPRAVTLHGWSILLARMDGAVYALVNTCTHGNALLSEGRLRRGTINCPLHGARFDIKTGECIGAAYLPLKNFLTRGIDGWIEIEIPSEPPAAPFIPVPWRP